jgi:signal transduction histidine kinase
MATLEIERKLDKDRIRALTQKRIDPEVDRMQKPIAQLREGLKANGLDTKLGPLVDKIESDYNQMRVAMLNSGISGTSLALVFHEVERGVRVLHQSIQDGSDAEHLQIQARELVRVLDGFSELLRKGTKSPNSLKRLLREARNINRVRFRVHNIRLVCPALEDDAPDIQAVFVFSLALGALSNLIDNAIHWSRMRWGDEEVPGGKSPRAIYMNITDSLGDGPAIVIADTGPGFQDSPEDMVRPFFTRRAEGMGLGLYYATVVMQLNDGDLLFPDRGDAEVPDEFDGGVLALRFAKVEQ